MVSVSSLKLAPKRDCFHASCPGNTDKVLQHKADLDRDVQAMPQSRCHLTGKFHDDLRSAVFTPSCCGLTLGGQNGSLSPLRLQLSHHLVAEELQIIKTLHRPVPHGGFFNNFLSFNKAPCCTRKAPREATLQLAFSALASMFSHFKKFLTPYIQETGALNESLSGVCQQRKMSLFPVGYQPH